MIRIILYQAVIMQLCHPDRYKEGFSGYIEKEKCLEEIYKNSNNLLIAITRYLGAPLSESNSLSWQMLGHELIKKLQEGQLDV